MLIKWYCRYVDPEWRFIPTRVGYTIMMDKRYYIIHLDFDPVY